MQQPTAIRTTQSDRPTISVDPDAPFDAHEFYAGLRALNVNPCIRRQPDGGFWESNAVGHTVGDVSQLVRWARAGDPDSSLRRAYAFTAWDNRPASDLPLECQLVPLGA
jgi:hypothetical protein